MLKRNADERKAHKEEGKMKERENRIESEWTSISICHMVAGVQNNVFPWHQSDSEAQTWCGMGHASCYSHVVTR